MQKKMLSIRDVKVYYNKCEYPEAAREKKKGTVIVRFVLIPKY
jgi:hypothetical protein